GIGPSDGIEGGPMNTNRILAGNPQAKLARSLGVAVALLVMLIPSAANAQQRFGTPEEAVNALAGAVRVGDERAILKVLGPAGASIVSSGDDVEDAATRARFV